MPGWRVPLLLAVALLATYALLVFVPFGVTDDYTNLYLNQNGEVWSWASIGSGRPLLAVFVAAGFSAVRRIGDLRYLRLIALIGVALVAVQLYAAMVRAGWDRWVAGGGAYLACVTPPFQCFAAWAICFSVPLALAMSVAGHRLAVRAWEAPRRAALTAGAVVLVAAAGMTYQPAMLIYVVPLAIDWLRPGGPPPRSFARLVWSGAVLAAGIAIAFIAYKVGLALYGSTVDSARTQLTGDILGKLEFFVTGPLIDALNLWLLWPSTTVALVVAAAIVAGLVLVTPGPPLRRLGSLGVAAGLLLLSYLANLAAGESWGSYRTQIALSPLVVVYALLAVQGFLRSRAPRALAALVTAGAVAAGLLAFDHVNAYYADPQMLELRLMRGQLRAIDLHKAKKILGPRRVLARRRKLHSLRRVRGALDVAALGGGADDLARPRRGRRRASHDSRRARQGRLQGGAWRGGDRHGGPRTLPLTPDPALAPRQRGELAEHRGAVAEEAHRRGAALRLELHRHLEHRFAHSLGEKDDLGREEEVARADALYERAGQVEPQE